jgi:hypothetical protein
MKTPCDCQPLTSVDKVNLDHAYCKKSEPAGDQNTERPVLEDKLKRLKVYSSSYNGLRQSNKPWQILSMNCNKNFF